MPKPSNPPKPKPPRSKHTRTTSPSGWTHITKGPPSHLPPHHTTALQHYHSTSAPSSSTPLETYISRFKHWYIPKWKASSCWKELSRLFVEEIIPSTRNNRVTGCVCLGLGSFTSSSTSTSTASSWQLAALLSILELLHTSSSSSPNNNNPNTQTPIPITFQDPIFNSTDVIFLTTHLPLLFLQTSINNNDQPVISVAVTVVEDPKAFERIDEGTFLFAPHLEVGVFARALEGTGEGEGEGPVVCVGSDVGEYVDGLLANHAEEARAGSVEVFKRFREAREEREMPGFERGDWCVALRVYWRNGKGDGRDEGMESVGMEVRV